VVEKARRLARCQAEVNLDRVTMLGPDPTVRDGITRSVGSVRHLEQIPLVEDQAMPGERRQQHIERNPPPRI
jgi:hypothetical protein